MTKIEIMEWSNKSEDAFMYVAWGHVDLDAFRQALADYYVSMGVFEDDEARDTAKLDPIGQIYLCPAADQVEADTTIYEPCWPSDPGARPATCTGWVG